MSESENAHFDLDRLTIKTPCPMDFDQMEGDERKRFCSRCQRHVYNIMEMSRHEVIDLIGHSGRRVCARLHRRPDGTLVARQCPPTGQSARTGRFQFSIAALITILTASAAVFASIPWVGKKLEPIVQRWFSQPSVAPPQGARVTMGVVCVLEDFPKDQTSALLTLPDLRAETDQTRSADADVASVDVDLALPTLIDLDPLD